MDKTPLVIERKKNPRVFYGFIVVAAGLIASIFIVGTYSTFGIFFKPLSEDFGWTRAETSVATSLAAMVMGISSILTGRFTDKYGPKVVLIASGLIIGAGTLLMSRMTNIWQLYVFWGLLVGAGMSASEIPVVATVARWFVKKRGMLTGVAKVGAGVGMMVVPLMASWLILSYGWRKAYVVVGLMALVGIIATALLFRRDPSEIGERPYGALEEARNNAQISIQHYSIREAVRTRQFWTFAGVWFSFVFTMNMITTHTANHVTDIGFSPTVAATVVSLFGAFSILGRLGLASLSDGLGTKVTYLIAFSLLATALLWVQFAQEVWMLYLFAALYGTAHGACFALLSPMTATLFGVQSLGSILGIILFIGTFGSLTSPTLAGWIFDLIGSYQPAFWISFAFCLFGIVLLCLLRSPNTRRE